MPFVKVSRKREIPLTWLPMELCQVVGCMRQVRGVAPSAACALRVAIKHAAFER